MRLTKSRPSCGVGSVRRRASASNCLGPFLRLERDGAPVLTRLARPIRCTRKYAGGGHRITQTNYSSDLPGEPQGTLHLRELRPKGNSPKFGVASTPSGAAASARRRHGGPHRASKRADYLPSVAPSPIERSRLPTSPPREDPSPSEVIPTQPLSVRWWSCMAPPTLNGRRCNGCGSDDRDRSPGGPTAHPSSPLRRSWDSTTCSPAR